MKPRLSVAHVLKQRRQASTAPAPIVLGFIEACAGGLARYPTVSIKYKK